MKHTTLTIAEAKRQIEELQRHIKHMLENTEERLIQSIKDTKLPFVVHGQKIKWEKINNDCDSTTDVYYIKLPLPIANVEWTFEVFDWVKGYVRAYNNYEDINSYPIHVPGSNINEMCIKVIINKQIA